MGLFGGRNRLRAYDPASMRMNNGIVEGDQQPIEMAGNNGFWQGGDKFTGRDGIAGILAVIGDAFAQQGGGAGGATPMLMNGRLSAIEMAKKQAEDQLQKQALMEAARQRGINPADVTLAQGGLGGIIPKGDDPTGFMRNEQYVEQRYGPEAAKAYAVPSLYGMTRGPDGKMYPITPSQAPDTLSDDEWNALPGGASGNARGGFPPRRRR